LNTDARALHETHATTKLQIGSELTRGAGAGGSHEIGRKAAEEDSEMIRGLFTDAGLLMVVAGLGCGTGTGSTPVILDLARESGLFTMCFATMPFKFEGEQRKIKAEEGLAQIIDLADIVVIVPNDRLFADSCENDLNAAFKKADEVLGVGVSAVWRLLTKPGFVKLNLADIRRIAGNAGGVCAFGYGDGTGKDRAETAMTDLWNNPLLDGGKVVTGAKAILLSIVGDPSLTLKEVGDITDEVTAKAQPGAHIFVGTVLDDTWKNRISITMLVAEQWSVEEKEPLSWAKTKGSARSDRKKKDFIQATIEFLPGKGRFKDAEPTVMDGEDLDIPTFIRKNIKIER
jgi:cell division protein FtsZ